METQAKPTDTDQYEGRYGVEDMRQSVNEAKLQGISPFCLTIDHQTLQDNTVTIRDRDSMKQERVRIDEVKTKMINACSMNNLLRKI